MYRFVRCCSSASTIITSIMPLLLQVVHVDMYDQPARMPPLMVNYHKDLAKATTGQDWRGDLKPINVTQPEGPSFTVEGNMVRTALQGFGGGVCCPVASLAS